MTKRFLLVSDVHYTTELTAAQLRLQHPRAIASAASGNAFGRTQRQKLQKLYDDILREHARGALAGVLVLGDLSIDDYDYRRLPESYCLKFRRECMDRLPVPCYALPGNHDSWPEDLWRDMLGTPRQYALELGGCVFLMADTFAATPANSQNPASGSPLTPLDEDFLRQSLQAYRGRPIFLCAHHLDESCITPACRALLRQSDVRLMFRGHTHVHGVVDGGQTWGVPLIDIGGYGYKGQVLNGKYDFNVYSPDIAWGYQMLEVCDDRVRTYHVQVANRYEATNGLFEAEEAIQNDITF